MKKLALAFVLATACNAALAIDTPYKQSIEYQVCFTPGQQCTDEIVKAINGAKKQLLVQAYQLTSAPIAQAITNAHNRGVDVRIVLDKSQQHGKRYSAAKYFTNQNMKVLIDKKPAIAHNKVMIIDDLYVITGSFNFSKNAQERNAENLLIIKNWRLAIQYKNNFMERARDSTLYDGNDVVNDTKPTKEEINDLLNAFSRTK
jgi:phosphatidylserine/phosphatidylglycerophosphate/cardiolipin synthase-like enzyme